MEQDARASTSQASIARAELHLPDSVILAIANHLYGTSLLRASQTDKRWRAILTGLVRTIIISPRVWALPPETPKARTTKLTDTFKGVQSVQVVMDANRNPRNFDPAVVSEALAPLASCPSLNTLQLTWRTWILPNEGYPEENFDAFVERWTTMTQLLMHGFKPVLPALAPKLTCVDINAQSNVLKMFQPQLTALTALTSLRYTLSDHYTTCTEDACVLSGLSSLKTLYIRCWLTPNFSETLLLALSKLTNLSSLEIDAISIPPDDNLVPSLSLLTNLQGLSSLRTKGMGLGSVEGLSKLTGLRDLTLTMSEGLGQNGWRELGCLTALTALNVNAWNDVAPVETTSTLQHVQSCEHISHIAALPLRALGIKIPGLRDIGHIAQLTTLTELILALQPPPGSLAGSPAAAAAAAGGLLRAPLAGASGSQSSLGGCVSALSELRNLRSLDVYDAGGHMRLSQLLLQDFCAWWPGLTNLYFEGIITVQSLGRAAMPRLDRLALINTCPVPFRVDFNQLPPQLTFIELQNAVVIHPGTGVGTSALDRQLCSASMMKGITWMDVTESSCMTSWLAGCSLLTSLRLDFSMGWFSDALQGQAQTPLAVLASAPSLQFLDLMLVDSSEGSEGLIDNRLISDLAKMAKLEELQVWTRMASDWHEDVGFLPLARGGTSLLRLLELEVLPYSKALVCRDVLSAAMPNCRFRLVADRIGELIA